MVSNPTFHDFTISQRMFRKNREKIQKIKLGKMKVAKRVGKLGKLLQRTNTKVVRT